MSSKVVSIYLKKEDIDKLDKISKDRGINRSQAVSMLLGIYSCIDKSEMPKTFEEALDYLNNLYNCIKNVNMVRYKDIDKFIESL